MSKEKTISCRLDEAEYTKLTELAERYQVSATSVIRRALSELYDGHSDQVPVHVNLTIHGSADAPEPERQASKEALEYLAYEAEKHAERAPEAPEATEDARFSPYLKFLEPSPTVGEAGAQSDAGNYRFDEETGLTTRTDPETGIVSTLVEVNVFG